MGEAPAIFEDDLQNGNEPPNANGSVFKSKGSETITAVGDKTYLIGGSDESIEVKIYDKSTQKPVTPTVLGTKPKPCKGHSALLVNEDRILVIKKGATPDDCIWFLEVDTQYVREQKKIVEGEVVAWSKGVIGNAQKPVVISGPSGVGKGTLISKLMKEFPSMFGFSVSHTTRAPRNKEKDGVDYHFTEKSLMEKAIKDGKFLEFASVHGNLYGTSVEAVEVVADAGKRCILDIDVQGAKSVRASSLEAIFIFICPPSINELEERLRARGTETEEQILKRLENARAEICQGKFSGIFGHVLCNDKLEECYKNLKKILGLDGNSVANNQTTPSGIDLPLDHSVSKIDNKILINCRTSESGKASENFIALDVFSLKGGAPGRTRGLHIFKVDSFSDGLNNNLS